MTTDLKQRPLVNTLSMATRCIHAYEFPSLNAEGISLDLITRLLELVFPLLWGGSRRAISPGRGSQNNACDEREGDFLFHTNLRSGG